MFGNLFGKLGPESIPVHEPIIMGTVAVIAVVAALLLGAITYFRK